MLSQGDGELERNAAREMILMTLTITGEAEKVEKAIVWTMAEVGQRFPDAEMSVRVKNTEYDGPPITIKDNTPDSWIK